MNSIFIALLLSLPFTFAQPVMNDITLQQYGDFSKKWRLVTVRYRTDTKEMRFTYANDKAWNALSKRKFYEDGSVFAKIGFKTDVDPAFNTSIVPSGARRFQFMVKNAKKYAETDGWGYALFDSGGQLFPEDIKTTTMACHACHKIVPERQFVFSEPIEFSPFLTHAPAVKKSFVNTQFSTLSPEQLVGTAAKFMKDNKIAKVDVVSGPMRTQFFSGTLDELTPLLLHQSGTQGSPSAFISEDGETFKIVKLSKSGKCSANEKSFEIFERRADHPETLKSPRKTDVCFQLQAN